MTTHRMTGTKTYRAWWDMLQRCRNPKVRSYRWYGARGISVCQRWHRFEAFFADMGVRPDGMSLERINCNKNYGPNNCRWATWKEQTRNSRANVVLEFRGKRQILTDWATEIGINRITLTGRIRLGWPVSRALTEPVRTNSRGLRK